MVEDRRESLGQGTKPVGLREGVPEARFLSRRLRAFGSVEVDHQRYRQRDELWVPPLKGLNLVLHLSGPHHVIHRRDGRSREGTGVRGTVHVVPPGSPVEWVWDGGGKPENVSVLVEGTLLRRVAEAAGADPDGLEVVERFGERDAQMERLMLSFLAELEGDGIGAGIYAESLATALAMHLLREHSSLGERAKRGVEREPKGGLSARALKAATDYVGDNLGRDLSLVGIAAAAGYSPHHFSRLFKRSTGLSPHQYVIRERVQKARELLANTDLSVGAVSRSVGFASQGHFAHQFKRLTGATPKEAAQDRRGTSG